jgi:hypothetical protein
MIQIKTTVKVKAKSSTLWVYPVNTATPADTFGETDANNSKSSTFFPLKLALASPQNVSHANHPTL